MLDQALTAAGVATPILALLGVVVRWLMGEVSGSRRAFMAALDARDKAHAAALAAAAAALAAAVAEAHEDRGYDREVRRVMHGALEKIALHLEQLAVAGVRKEG